LFNFLFNNFLSYAASQTNKQTQCLLKHNLFDGGKNDVDLKQILLTGLFGRLHDWIKGEH